MSFARSPAGPLLLRVVVASLFLWEAFNQIRKGWIGGDGLEHMITSALNGHAVPPFFRSFLENVVLAHDQTFTFLAITGEAAIGAALLLGVATRLSAVVALLMNANFLLLNGLTAGGAIDAAWIVLEILIVAWAIRDRWSLDGALAGRGVWFPWVSAGERPPPAAVI